MIRLSKAILLFFIVGCCSAFAIFPSETRSVESEYELKSSRSIIPLVQAKALTVLKNKCNVCHLKKNKSVIFNEKNMVEKARKIQKMVFVKKKMPKDDVTLTDAERKDLRAWLDSLGL